MSLFQTRVQFSPGMQSDSSHSDRTRPTWSPYDNNGGTTLAVAGEDYCIVAASVRLATGFSILSRDSTRIKILNQRCVMSSSGFQADYQTLQKLLGARQVMYQHNHNKPMACSAMAQLLSNTLYYKRFFPYYSFNLLGGLDDQGEDVRPPAGPSSLPFPGPSAFAPLLPPPPSPERFHLCARSLRRGAGAGHVSAMHSPP
uniref:Proteasome subunit beta n=1 Tax=Tetraselmis sp. GSL018 TaxID=582737 RepID=A0A061SC03_9CHLO